MKIFLIIIVLLFLAPLPVSAQPEDCTASFDLSSFLLDEGGDWVFSPPRLAQLNRTYEVGYQFIDINNVVAEKTHVINTESYKIYEEIGTLIKSFENQVKINLIIQIIIAVATLMVMVGSILIEIQLSNNTTKELEDVGKEIVRAIRSIAQKNRHAQKEKEEPKKKRS